jgi:predicted metal-binding protein
MTLKDEEKDVIISQLKEVVVNRRSRDWCKLPYTDHPHGCPNYGKRKTCPPQSPLFEKIVKSPFTLVAVKFNLENHVKKMKKKHPGWSDRKARCVLYWQKKMNRCLRETCERIASNNPNSVVLYKPEANGVNVFETCRKIGLILEKNPQKIVWKIAIIGNKSR